MNTAAKLVLFERSRRRNELSQAAEEHTDRLQVALGHAASCTSSSAAHRRGSLNRSGGDQSHEKFIEMRDGNPKELLVMLLEELHARASLQLDEAVQFSRDILQPFGCWMAILAAEYHLDCTEAALLHLATQSQGSSTVR